MVWCVYLYNVCVRVSYVDTVLIIRIACAVIVELKQISEFLGYPFEIHYLE